MAGNAKSLEAQRKELEKKLADIQRQEAEIVEKKKVVIGALVWAEMQNNEEFCMQIMRLLDDKLTKNADRILFGFAKKERKAKTTQGGDVVGEG